MTLPPGSLEEICLKRRYDVAYAYIHGPNCPPLVW